MEQTKQEKKLRELLHNYVHSVSHDFDHLDKVAEFAEQLAEFYGARKEIVTAAALLHDLARTDTDKRGKESAEAGASQAAELLKQAGYSTEDISLITQCIREHDQPSFHSQLIESKILKDADFLDGFGVRGILRSLIYAGETRGGVPEALERLQVKMRQRMEGLEFVESRRLAWTMYRFAERFLGELSNQPNMQEAHYSGKLVVLEGISGSGKDTQAELLSKYLQTHDVPNLVVHHPSALLKELWKEWLAKVFTSPYGVALSLVADRYREVNAQVIPALQQGKVVISTRSSISAQVYQAAEGISADKYRYLFQFEPVPDLVIYLDVPTDSAYERTQKRVNEGVETDRGFFGQKQNQQRQRYQQILQSYPNVQVVNAAGSIEEVHQQLVSCFTDHLSLR
jgi:dTMP kinase